MFHWSKRKTLVLLLFQDVSLSALLAIIPAVLHQAINQIHFLPILTATISLSCHWYIYIVFFIYLLNVILHSETVFIFAFLIMPFVFVTASFEKFVVYVTIYTLVCGFYPHNDQCRSGSDSTDLKADSDLHYSPM